MTKLETITAEDLQNRTYEPAHFLVDELIPEGLHILAGAPKIGKSWLALWLCLCVAQGSLSGILQQPKAKCCISVSKIRFSVSRRGSLT